MFNDIEWEARANEELCKNNSKIVAEYARQFPSLSWGLDPRKSGTELSMAYQVDIGTQTAEKMLLNFEKSGHSIFRVHQCPGKKGQVRKQRETEDNYTFHSV